MIYDWRAFGLAGAAPAILDGEDALKITEVLYLGTNIYFLSLCNVF